MAVLMLTSHEVKDYASWKQGFDAHKGAREGAGLKEVFVGQDAANPNLVHLGFHVPSEEAAKGFLEASKDKLAEAGVIGVPETRIVRTG